MCDYGISAAIIGSVVTAAAATATSAYTSAQTRTQQNAAANEAKISAAQNQAKADEVASKYRAQQEALRLKAYHEAEAERARQKGLQDEADAQLRESMKQAAIAQQNKLTDQEEASLKGNYGTVATDAAQATVPGLNDSAEAQDSAGTRVVKEGYQKALKGVGSVLDQLSGSQAKLDARETAGLLDSIQQNRNAGELNRVQNFMQGSANVLPIEINATNTARSILDQQIQDEMALFSKRESDIGSLAAQKISDASAGGQAGQSIADLLSAASVASANYAANKYYNKPAPTAKTSTSAGKVT